MRLRSRKLRHCIALVILCVLVPLAISAQDEAPKTQAIRGQVLNRVTHEAVPRALVHSPDHHFATMTDGDGRFEFSPLESTKGSPSAPDMLIARKPGFLGNERDAPSVSPGKDVTLWLTPESFIVGRVLLPTGETSERISVQLCTRMVQNGRARWQPNQTVRTNSHGEFRFAGLEAGTYKVFTHELMDRDPLIYDPNGQIYGFPPVYFPNAADLDSAASIKLTAGQTFQADLPLTRHPYYRVKIALANWPPGQSWTFDVKVLRDGHSGPGYELGYNPEVRMIEGLLPDGNYLIQASAFADSSVTGMIALAIKGGPVEDARLMLVPNGTVTVNIAREFTLDEQRPAGGRGGGGIITTSRPYSDVEVQLEAADPNPQLSTVIRSTNSGNTVFAFQGIAPGRYWVRPYPSHGYAASIRAGELDLQQQPLVVGLGGSVSVELTMRDDGAEITGRIESPNKPGTFDTKTVSSPARVYCVPLPDSRGEPHEMWVESDGSFHQEQIAPGTYRLIAFDHVLSSPLEYRNPQAMRAFDGKGQVIRLVAGQKERVQLQVITTDEE